MLAPEFVPAFMRPLDLRNPLILGGRLVGEIGPEKLNDFISFENLNFYSTLLA
jgi:hypothetical protein